MTTLPKDLDLDQFVISTNSASQHAVKWHGKVIGMIQCSPELGLQWEYTRYSKYPETFKGTYFECAVRAREEFENLHEPLHSIISTDYIPLANWHWVYYPKAHVAIDGNYFGCRAEIEKELAW